jgi:Xaa-Pro dipeptidase
MTSSVSPISKQEFLSRIERLQALLKQNDCRAIYLHAGTNLYYFTGLQWSPSERMVAAIIPAEGEIQYIAPHFEQDTLRDYWLMEADIHGWHEHESPYLLFKNVLSAMGIDSGTVLLDESTPYFIVAGLTQANPGLKFDLAQPITQSLRARKSEAEIALIERAHAMTMEVHKAAASILKVGITTTQVEEFIDQAHQAVGAPAGSYFCIVLFGVATSFPHGVKEPQTLVEDDRVLVDTGCVLHGYISDTTRSFCFGEPRTEHRSAWAAEHAAQLAAFQAAQLGQPCEAADAAARASLVASGYGPDYELPGLPHRTGHGCGLDIHEGPNLVRGETRPLEVGMVFSDEPMLVIPGQFGVRLEDHFHMTSKGPKWITQPSHSIDDPFGLAIN